MLNTKEIIESLVYGGATGDAIGAVYENKPITNTMDGETPVMFKGIWTDDTSMTIALIDSLYELDGKIDSVNEVSKFTEWIKNGAYSAIDGKAIGTGATTRRALLEYGHGLNDEKANGNGSLMRISPLAFTKATDAEIMLSSAITHAHWISVHACIQWVHAIRSLWNLKASVPRKYEKDGQMLLRQAMRESSNYMTENDLEPASKRLREIWRRPVSEIKSTGYVVDTIEAVYWLLGNSTDYTDVINGAIKLGGDTDTIAKIAGEAAAIAYGIDSIPDQWRDKLVKKELLDRAVDQLDEVWYKSTGKTIEV